MQAKLCDKIRWEVLTHHITITTKGIAGVTNVLMNTRSSASGMIHCLCFDCCFRK